VYLRAKTFEHMKETRKKELIVERFEAKLKQEAEMLALEAQRASETRQRQRDQRTRGSANARRVRLSLSFECPSACFFPAKIFSCPAHSLRCT